MRSPVPEMSQCGFDTSIYKSHKFCTVNNNYQSDIQIKSVNPSNQI